MEQRLLNLVFERFLPPFKIGDMVWLRHIFSEIVIRIFAKAALLGQRSEAARYSKVLPHTLPKRSPLILRTEEPEAPQATRLFHVKSKQNWKLMKSL
jgi:hypothetical protein